MLSVPTTMVVSNTCSVRLRLKNTGTRPLDTIGSQCNAFRLGSVNPTGNMTWGRNRVDLPKIVEVGGQVNVDFTVTAPSTPGTYSFQWQLMQQCVGWFPSPSPDLSIVVRARAGAKDAQVLSQRVPGTMVKGQTYTAKLVVKNVGTQAWNPVTWDPASGACAATAFRLGSRNPADNQTWGKGRQSLASTVAPGEDATISFSVAAPATAGSYNFQWRMLQECVSWFGDTSPNKVISVTN